MFLKPFQEKKFPKSEKSRKKETTHSSNTRRKPFPTLQTTVREFWQFFRTTRKLLLRISKGIEEKVFFILIIASLPCIFAKSYGTSLILDNKNAIVATENKFTLSFGIRWVEKLLLNLSNYNIIIGSLCGSYTPDDSVEVSFKIPYLKIIEAKDNGILGDIELSSKFVLVREVFSVIDTFLLQNALIINLSLATGVKKEDSYRSIGLQKGTYFPLSSGYSDIEIGNATTVVGGIFALSAYVSFVSASSKIEPPLAFNTENDHFTMGGTIEMFIYSSKSFTFKTFAETLWYVPITDKSKYLNFAVAGAGGWTKIFDTVIITLGYYKNLLLPTDIEKYLSENLTCSIGIRL